MFSELIKGFRFGMLLQLAVGPICLFLMQNALTLGSAYAMSGVLAVVIVDACYIAFAILGLGAIINKANMKRWLKLFGGIVLILFGLDMILSFYNISIIPSLKTSNSSSSSIFMQTLIMTLSNPLTILFWTGVFTTQISDENRSISELCIFGTGAVLSTFVFLSVVVLVAGEVSGFMSSSVLNILNLIVGMVIVFFGARLLMKKVETI